MSKRAKVILLLFISLGVLFILISTLAALLIDLNKYRPLVVTKIEETLHRKAYIGQIKHTLWTGLGAEINQVTILDKDESRPFIHADQVVARVRWIPLLYKKIEVSTLVLKNPHIFLERAESGVWNFEDILPVTPTTAFEKSDGKEMGEKRNPKIQGDTETRRPGDSFIFSPQVVFAASQAPSHQGSRTTNGGQELPPFSIDLFRIVNGTVMIQDFKVNKETTFSHINLEAQDIAPDSRVPFTLTTSVNGEKPSTGGTTKSTPATIHASGTIGPLPRKGHWKDMEFALKARLEEVDLSRFAPYYKRHIGAELIDGAVGGEIKLTGKLGAYINSEGTLKVTDFLWKDPEIFTSPLKGVNAAVDGALSINLREGDLKVVHSNVTTAAIMMDISGEVENVKTKPQINLSIKLENLDWNKLFALFPPEARPTLLRTDGHPPLHLEGIASIALQPQGSLQDLTLTGTIDLKESQIQYKNIFSKPRGVPGQIVFEGHFGGDTLTLSNLAVNINDVQMVVAGTVGDLKTGEPAVDLKITSQSFLPEKLMELFPRTAGIDSKSASKASSSPDRVEGIKISGPGNLTISLKGKLKDLLAEGSVNFDQSELRYKSLLHKAPDVPANLAFSSKRREDEFNLENLTLRLGPLVLNATGSVTGIGSKSDSLSPSIHLEVVTNKFKLDELQQQLTPASTSLLPTDVTLTGPTELKLQVEGPVNKLQVMTDLDLTDNGIRYKDLFSKPAKIKSDLKVEAGLDAGQFNIDNITFSLEDMVLKATGTIGSPGNPDLNLQIDSNTFEVATLLKAIPVASGFLPEEVILSGKTSFSIKPKGKPENLTLVGNINLDKGYLQYGQVFQKQVGVPGNLDFNVEIKKDDRTGLSSLNLSNSSLHLGNLALRIDGSIENLQNPKLNLDLSTNPFDLVEFQNKLLPTVSLADLILTGPGQLQVHVEGSPQALEIKSGVDLTKNQIRYKDFFVKPEGVKSDLALEAGLSKGDVTLKNLTLLLEDLQLRVKGIIARTYNGASPQREPQLNLDIVTDEFDIQKLLQKLPRVKSSLPKGLDLTGPTRLQVKTAGPPSNLRLTGSVNLDKGEASYGILFKKASGIPGRLEFDVIAKKERFEIEALRLNINDLILDIKGFITGFNPTGVKSYASSLWDLHLRSNAFAFNPWILQSETPDDQGKIDLDVSLKGKWEDIAEGRGINGTINFKKVRLALPNLPKSIENLSASAVLAGREITVKDLTGQLGSSVFTGNLNIRDLNAPKVQFDLHASKLNLDEWMEGKDLEKKASWKKNPETWEYRDSERGELPIFFVAATPFADQAPEPIQLVQDSKPSRSRKPAPGEETPLPKMKEEKPTGSRTPQPVQKIPGSGSLEDLLRKIQAQGTITVDQGTAKEFDFSRLTTQAQMTDQVIRLNNLVFNFYDGTHQGAAVIDLNTTPAVYEVTTRLTQVNARKLFAEKTSLKHVIYGLLFVNMKLQGKGFDTQVLSRTLTGSGDLEIRNGKFTAFSIFHELAPLFEWIGQIGKAKEFLALSEQFKKAPPDTEFSLFKGHFNIRDGQAGTGDLMIQVRDPTQNLNMDLEITGNLGLNNTALDLTGRISFFKDFKYYPELVKYFPERDGKVTIPFPIPIEGTLFEPEFNLAGIQNSVVKFAANIALQKGIQLGLDKIFKKKEKNTEQDVASQTSSEQQPSPEPQPPLESQEKLPAQKKPEEVLEDISKGILDQIFKKRR
ncbi:MAG TPA: AsmA family protein [Candidatus Limnocylindrales bacterium]|nr:AsmA family protein [Candidatus Limnocylindrales bacterium]